jgi:hypothetical protein
MGLEFVSRQRKRFYPLPENVRSPCQKMSEAHPDYYSEMVKWPRKTKFYLPPSSGRVKNPCNDIPNFFPYIA